MRQILFVLAAALAYAAPAAAQDPVKVDPKHYKVEYENESIRVLTAAYQAAIQAANTVFRESIIASPGKFVASGAIYEEALTLATAAYEEGIKTAHAKYENTLNEAYRAEVEKTLAAEQAPDVYEG